MAKARRKKQKRSIPSAIENFIRPTDERLAHNDVESAGAARRITPPIDMLFRQGKLDQRRYEALHYYRDQANLANKSEVRCGIDFSIRGGGYGPGVAITSAMLETARMERDIGSLCDIVQAVARDDMTLTKWCIHRHGGRERYDGSGRFIAMVPNRERDVMRMALMELRMAADRIVF